LLLPQILPVFSVVAPCHPGAALRDLVLVQPIQITRRGHGSAEAPRTRRAAAWCLFAASLVDTLSVMRILRHAYITPSSAPG
jgi:hypothetical protein